MSLGSPGISRKPAASSGSKCSAPGMAEAARVAVTLLEFLHHFEANLFYGEEHQLCDPIAWINSERVIAAIPAGDFNFPLVIAVDKSDQVAQHDTVLMTKT